MKVLMINTVAGYGSTGSICEDIANVLEQQGHECYIAYGQLSTSYHKSFKIGTRIENHLHNVGSRLIGKQGYFSKKGTKHLISYIENIKPDVIHLHNLHGNYLNLQILFKFLKDYTGKIFWTFHDCWPFTGKCAHYTTVECYKWKTHCNMCPQVKAYPPSMFLDYSYSMFDDKKNFFLNVRNLKIITVSDWLRNQVEESFFKKTEVKRIYNWVDHNIFDIKNDYDQIKKYGINKELFHVICVSATWNKGDTKLEDFLKFAQKLSAECHVIMIGKVGEGILLPSNVIQIPYIHEKKDLAFLYSFANAYIHLSSEDTFGKVIAEALSCGTPAVVYNSTACPEIVDEKTGLVVEDRNVEEIAKAVLKIKNKEVKFIPNECRNRVLNYFDIKKNINETIDYYNS